ncbi:hypothetical protein AB835_14175 [Candidatus Endobugula sertula]|uniref:Uncharacterized protein n=1 Tax=Candidatus Endobugula sertula TaxID=62101 RepID=A0A1D2QLJ4_9GAMM|nr:hypothetical protein AB835_14175 [Candidatus Endobugula sertula]
MLWLLYFTAIFAVVVQGQELQSDTNYYYTVNSFKTQESFSFSCYNSTCNIFSSPPGAGCDEKFITNIGTVAENETKLLTSNFVFGGGFCSDNQVGVFYSDDYNNILAQLPRATEGGTKFHMSIYGFDEPSHYQCSFSALSFTANVEFSLDTNAAKQNVSVSRFLSHQINITVDATAPKLIKVVSDYSIIVSCVANISPDRLVTFQPISSEPLFTTSSLGSFVSVVLSDCATNALVTDFDRVRVTIGFYEDYGCVGTPVESDEIIAYTTNIFCSVLVEPLDDQICVSMGNQYENSYLANVGIPESKFTVRLANYPKLFNAAFFSFSLATCTFQNSDDRGLQTISLQWLYSGVLSDKISVFPSYINFQDVEWATCDKPILVMISDLRGLEAFVSAYQPEELWEPFFKAENTIPAHSLTPATTTSNAYPLTPAATSNAYPLTPAYPANFPSFRLKTFALVLYCCVLLCN